MANRAASEYSKRTSALSMRACNCSISVEISLSRAVPWSRLSFDEVIRLTPRKSSSAKAFERVFGGVGDVEELVEFRDDEHFEDRWLDIGEAQLPPTLLRQTIERDQRSESRRREMLDTSKANQHMGIGRRFDALDQFAADLSNGCLVENVAIDKLNAHHTIEVGHPNARVLVCHTFSGFPHLRHSTDRQDLGKADLQLLVE